ncbi:MAG: type IV secretory system conjugative DNA transfer family protein [Firmicutes bacterium]|nr:type IV secretory system conjugative DNA transfer family protein [Bacillota bacterium]
MITSLVVLALSSLGFITAMISLPTPFAPLVITAGMGLIALTGFSRNRTRKVGLIYFAALLFSTAWAISSFAPEINSYLISSSKVVDIQPKPMIQMLMLMPLILGSFLAPKIIEEVKAGDIQPRQETIVDQVLKTTVNYLKLKSGKERAPVSDVGAMLNYIIKNVSPPENLDLEFCIDVKANRPVTLEGTYRYRNTLITGPPGSGKTVTLKNHIFQDLDRISSSLKYGRPMGLTLLEPKGDLVDEVAARCQELNIPFHYINPLSPFTAQFNPMMGPSDVAAESTRTVLRNIFGKQEAFFAVVQETAARNTILLVKQLQGDDLDMLDVLRCLRDRAELEKIVSTVERRDGESDLTEYFRKEAMGRSSEHYHQFTMGLRVQLEDLVGNDMLKRVLLGKRGVDLDKHLAEGGVMLVNSAMGRLGKLGDTLGKFLAMHLMNAVFRRPGSEHERPPHFLYVDEFPRYMNEGFEILLNIARSYRCATTLAIQGFSQMEFNLGESFRKVVMNSCQNKIVFGGMDEADAKLAEAEMGLMKIQTKEPSYEYRPLIPHVFPKAYRIKEKDEPRYTYTQLMELPPYHFVYRMVRFGNLQQPSVGKSRLIKNNTVFQPMVPTEPPADTPTAAVPVVNSKPTGFF